MIKKRSILDLLWAIFGVFFSKIFPLLGSLALIRLFDQSEYGTYALTTATINMLLTVTGAGLVGGLVAKISAKTNTKESDRSHQHIQSFNAVNAILLGIILIATTSASLLGLLDGKLETIIKDNWAPMLLLIIIQVQLAIQSAVATVSGLLRKLALSSLVGGTLAAALQVPGAIKWGVPGAIWGMALGYGAQAVLQYRFLRSAKTAESIPTPHPRLTRASLISAAWNDFLQYGGYMFGASALVSIGMWLLPYSLTRYGAGMPDVAAFGVLAHWRMLLLFVPMALSNYLTSRFASRSQSRLPINILFKSLTAITALLTLLSIATILLSAPILETYGESYKGLTTELYLSAMIALISGFNSVIGNFLIGANLFRQGFLSNVVWFAGLVTALTIFRTDGFDVREANNCLLLAYLPHTIYQLIILFYSYKNKHVSDTPKM